MRIIVRCCADCVLKRVGKNDVKCKVGDMVIMTATDQFDMAGKVHAKCPLLGGPIEFALEAKAKHAAGASLEAFCGNRVLLSNGQRGIVVCKWKNAKHAGVDAKDISAADKRAPWYRILMDGVGTGLVAESAIEEILSETPEYNFNPEYEFYFGAQGAM